MVVMDVHILVVPYDTARRGWRSGAGPEHLLAAGLATHLHSRGHFVANIELIDDDPDQPPAEIRTAFELAGAFPQQYAKPGRRACFHWFSAGIATLPSGR